MVLVIIVVVVFMMVAVQQTDMCLDYVIIRLGLFVVLTELFRYILSAFFIGDSSMLCPAWSILQSTYFRTNGNHRC